MIEATLSLGVTGVLLTGVASSMVIATRSLPTPNATTSRANDAAEALDQIAGELSLAKSILLRNSKVIRFTVADRDNNGTDEIIRYSWSGTAGDPLQRSYNGATGVAVVDGVQAFELAYSEDSVSSTETVTTTTETAESLLAYFDGWSGITPTPQEQGASSTRYVSQYFTYTPPANAISVTFTRARAFMRRDALFPASFTMEIRRSKNDGSYQPATSSVGTPATVSGALLQLTAQWLTGYFSNVTFTDPSRTDYCLLIRGPDSNTVWAQLYNSATAPANGTCGLWSTNTGGSWSPANKDKDKYDFRYYVYGKYTTTTTSDQVTTKNLLRGVTVRAQAGTDAAADLRVRVRTLNAPDVTGL